MKCQKYNNDMMSRQVLCKLLVGLLCIILLSCSSSKLPIDATIKKYSSPPKDSLWELVNDTEEFWNDVDVLYKASVQGHKEAFHTLLTIHAFTDGAVGECMPNTYWVVQEYPEMAREIILEDARLKKNFGHWIEEIQSCNSSKSSIDITIKKYSSPPEGISWELVNYTEEFWKDVAILYKASVQGHKETFRTLLTIETFTDRAVGRYMPDTYWVAHEYPAMACEIILGDNRLKKTFGFWIEEIQR